MDLLFLLKVYLVLGSLLYLLNIGFAVKGMLKKHHIKDSIQEKGEQKNDER